MIGRLLQRFSEAKAREAALTSEAQVLAGRIGEIRQALGNPFFYSGPRHGRTENADKSMAKFTGYESHEIGRQLIQDLQTTKVELGALRKQLRKAGVNVE